MTLKLWVVEKKTTLIQRQSVADHNYNKLIIPTSGGLSVSFFFFFFTWICF